MHCHLATLGDGSDSSGCHNKHGTRAHSQNEARTTQLRAQLEWRRPIRFGIQGCRIHAQAGGQGHEHVFRTFHTDAEDRHERPSDARTLWTLQSEAFEGHLGSMVPQGCPDMHPPRTSPTSGRSGSPVPTWFPFLTRHASRRNFLMRRLLRALFLTVLDAVDVLLTFRHRAIGMLRRGRRTSHGTRFSTALPRYFPQCAGPVSECGERGGAIDFIEFLSSDLHITLRPAEIHSENTPSCKSIFDVSFAPTLDGTQGGILG